jgi:hypothetical protein
MYHLLMRLRNDEEKLLRRTTQDETQRLMGPIPRGPKPIPGGPKPGPLRAEPQPSPKPRARPHTPVADALAAWRAYVARRHAKGDAPA